VVRNLARIVALAFLAVAFSGAAQAERITIFAAASLKNALDEIALAWGRDNPDDPAIVSYAASSALAKQIEEGAPADIFFSADLVWMDYLATAGMLKDGTRANVVGNRLVVIGSSDAPPIDFGKHVDFAALLQGGRLAVADVQSVPAGKYAKAALEKLGLWNDVAANLAQAENVRAALALVARGEAPAGIVYATDAHSEPGVKVLGVIPQDAHAPIVYPAAAVAASRHDKAEELVRFLKAGEAQTIFAAHGFQTVQ
jgi:molybdate transport system substrate-binding protein